MTTARRRVLRPVREVPAVDPQRQSFIERRRVQLDEERAAFDRWMTRLKRVFHEIEKRQKRVARIERTLTRLEQSWWVDLMERTEEMHGFSVHPLALSTLTLSHVDFLATRPLQLKHGDPPQNHSEESTVQTGAAEVSSGKIL